MDTTDEMAAAIRIKIADFLCTLDYPIDVRVIGLIHVACASIVSLPGNSIENVKWGFENFASTLSELSPHGQVVVEVVDRRKKREVH